MESGLLLVFESKVSFRRANTVSSRELQLFTLAGIIASFEKGLRGKVEPRLEALKDGYFDSSSSTLAEVVRTPSQRDSAGGCRTRATLVRAFLIPQVTESFDLISKWCITQFRPYLEN